MKTNLAARRYQSAFEPASDSGARRLGRRRFLNTLAPSTAGLAMPKVLCAVMEIPPIRKPRKLRYLGWQVGIIYQTPAAGGMTRDDLWRLIDEMASHRMNLLSLMMLSYAFFDPQHDGYCWPVQNPKLEHNRDKASVNGQPKTEFVRDAIAYAAERGIEV
jgi:hypothetical protein